MKAVAWGPRLQDVPPLWKTPKERHVLEAARAAAPAAASPAAPGDVGGCSCASRADLEREVKRCPADRECGPGGTQGAAAHNKAAIPVQRWPVKHRRSRTWTASRYVATSRGKRVRDRNRARNRRRSPETFRAWRSKRESGQCQQQRCPQLHPQLSGRRARLSSRARAFPNPLHCQIRPLEPTLGGIFLLLSAGSS